MQRYKIFLICNTFNKKIKLFSMVYICGLYLLTMNIVFKYFVIVFFVVY